MAYWLASATTNHSYPYSALPGEVFSEKQNYKLTEPFLGGLFSTRSNVTSHISTHTDTYSCLIYSYLLLWLLTPERDLNIPSPHIYPQKLPFILK